MPFDPAPREVEAPAKAARFQRWADALMRGASTTLPSITRSSGQYDLGLCRVSDGERRTHTCAYYAMAEGFGKYWPGDEREMRAAYRARYGSDFVDDYEDHGVTREQIAARIAAL